MKKLFASIPALLLMLLSLSGCNRTGEKSSSLSAIYAVAAILSLALLIGCLCLVKKKKAWFIVLFSSVLIVNTGYTLLSVSTVV